MRRSFTLAGILLALTSASAAAQAGMQEPVSLRLGGQPGQTNKYQSTMEVFMRGGPMAMMGGGDTTVPTMRFNTFVTRTINGVAGDTITFADVVDSARAETPAMPQMGAMMGGMASNLRGQTTTTRMDNRGRFYSVEVTNANNANNADGAGGPGGPGGPGGRGNAGRMPGRNQRFLFVLPAGPVRPGETWSDSMLVAGSENEGSTNFLASYKLESVTQQGSSRVAVVSMNGTMATNGPAGPQVMSVAGEFQFDVTGRRIASFTMTLTGTVSSPQGDIPVKMHMTQSLTS